MNDRQVEGKWDKTKGELKKGVGDLTGDEDLKAEGTWDKVKGAVKEGVGDVEDALDDDKV